MRRFPGILNPKRTQSSIPRAGYSLGILRWRAEFWEAADEVGLEYFGISILAGVGMGLNHPCSVSDAPRGIPGAAFPGWASLEVPLESPNPTPSRSSGSGAGIGIIPWLEPFQVFGFPVYPLAMRNLGFPAKSFPFFPRIRGFLQHRHQEAADYPGIQGSFLWIHGAAARHRRAEMVSGLRKTGNFSGNFIRNCTDPPQNLTISKRIPSLGRELLCQDEVDPGGAERRGFP